MPYNVKVLLAIEWVLSNVEAQFLIKMDTDTWIDPVTPPRLEPALLASSSGLFLLEPATSIDIVGPENKSPRNLSFATETFATFSGEAQFAGRLVRLYESDARHLRISALVPAAQPYPSHTHRKTCPIEICA